MIYSSWCWADQVSVFALCRAEECSKLLYENHSPLSPPSSTPLLARNVSSESKEEIKQTQRDIKENLFCCARLKYAEFL